LKNLMRKWNNLEIAYTEKENEIQVITQEHRIELREYEEDRDHTNKNLNESAEGYNISFQDSSHPIKFHNPKHVAIFNTEIGDLSDENSKLTKVVNDLVKVTSKVLSQFKEHHDATEWQEKVLNRIDKEVGQILNEQKGMKEKEDELHKYFNQLNIDFEDHWKLIQQVIRDNNDIGDQVTQLQKIEIPAIRNYIINRSNAMTNPLGYSNPMTNNIGVSTLLNTQLQTSKITEQNLENSENLWADSESSVNQPSENIKEDFFQESTNLRGDGSLCSNDFNLINPDNESDLGVLYQTSILENIADVASGVSESSGDQSIPRKSFQEDNKVSQGEFHNIKLNKEK